MNEPEKRRKRDGRHDGTPATEEGDDIVAARDSMMAEVRAMLEQTCSHIMTEMQGKMDAIERRSDELAKKCQSQEERCRYLEARCDSLERSVQILANNQNWESSAPDIPDSYWEERGFDEAYVKRIVGFIQRMKNYTRRMRSGKNAKHIRLGWDGGQNVQLLYDEALLPHWREFADALQLSNYFSIFAMGKIQLPSSVLDMIVPALATKKIKTLGFDNNDFSSASDGIKFATELIQNNPHLEHFQCVNNPIIVMNQVIDLLKVVIIHPKLNKIRLENSLGPNVNGYDVLRSLLGSNKNFLEIRLKSSNIATRGRSDLPDFLATNPPLQFLCLANNNLDDDDAVFIADALKHNTNLQTIRIKQNDITHVGWDALFNAVFDASGLNAMSDCNHTCQIVGLTFFGKNRHSNPNLHRGWKLYCLLTARYHEGSILNYLDLEFGDDAVKFVPKVLECVHLYSGYLRPASQRPAEPLSITFEILRGWKMPELFECHNRR